jgi:hypothetical protein
MNRQLIEDLAQDLSRRRSLLLQGAAENQDDMKAILDQRESEFEESAQKDRITHLISVLPREKMIGGLIHAGPFKDDFSQRSKERRH